LKQNILQAGCQGYCSQTHNITALEGTGGKNTVSQKSIPNIFDCQLSESDNLWYRYSWHNLPSNDHSVPDLTQRLFLHYMGKTQPAKYHFFIQCDMIA